MTKSIEERVKQFDGLFVGEMGRSTIGGEKEFIQSLIKQVITEALQSQRDEIMGNMGKQIIEIITNGKSAEEQRQDIIKLFNIIAG